MVTVSTADKIATRGVPRPTCGEQVDRVLDNVVLCIEIGKNVDRGVGDKKRFRIGRHVHYEDMADAAGRAQPGLAGRHRRHQLIGMQAALHQELALRLMNELHAFCRSGVAVRDVNDFDRADIETMLTGHGSDLSGRTDKNWNNDAVLRTIHRAAQRTLIARMYDDGFGCRNALCAGNQPVIF